MATLLLLGALSFPTPSCASLSESEKAELISKTITLVDANYVFPDRAKDVAAALRANLSSGKYLPLDEPDAFLEALNEDLQAAAGDRHLRVVANPRIVAQLRREASGSKEVDPDFLQMVRSENFRLRKVESLDGNIGYFKFDNFVELRFVEDALVGAMNFLNSSSAIVLDLTDNGGGASETVDFLLGYFLPAGTVIGETFDRTTGTTATSIVDVKPGVKPLLATPLYVLLSERTASAAEALAYTLQQAKRAIVVGSSSKGMANAGVQRVLDDRLFLIVPTMRHVNAVSGTNWEGVGLVPDVAVAPDKAFPSAMASALRLLADRASSHDEQAALRFHAKKYDALVAPERPPVGLLAAAVGEYGAGRLIELQGESLHFVQGESNRKLTYMSDLTFRVEGREDYRLRFPLDDGRASSLDVIWYDDTSDSYPRTSRNER